MARLDAIDRVLETTEEFSASQPVDHEAATAAVDRVIAHPTEATPEDWQTARETYPDAFEDGGDR